MLNLDLPIQDTALLRQHLATCVKSVQAVYPSVRIGDWDVYFNPRTVSRCRTTGVPLCWVARAASRTYESNTLESLLEALAEDARAA